MGQRRGPRPLVIVISRTARTQFRDTKSLTTRHPGRRCPGPSVFVGGRRRFGNRSNYVAWGGLSLPGQDRELSVYGTEAYYVGPASRLRRFVYRTDGFVFILRSGDLYAFRFSD